MAELLDKGYLFTDIGPLEVAGNEEGIVSVTFVDNVDTAAVCGTSVVQECITELNQYFGGRRTEFAVRLNPGGTEFRSLVWHALRNIPFGRTTSYRDIAVAIGSDGSLTGYAGGLDRKRWLLEHERRVLAAKG